MPVGEDNFLFGQCGVCPAATTWHCGRWAAASAPLVGQ